jgi:hypothetical protein
MHKILLYFNVIKVMKSIKIIKIYELEFPEPTPAQKLLIALIHRAASDILFTNAEFTSAYDKRFSNSWIQSDEDNFFSFYWCCRELGVCHKKIRRQINKLKREKLC